MIYALACLLILVGLYGAVASRNVIRIVIGLLVSEHGVHLLLVLIGYRRGGGAPILEPAEVATALAGNAVDPLPQALVLTAIVIGWACSRCWSRCVCASTSATGPSTSIECGD